MITANAVVKCNLYEKITQHKKLENITKYIFYLVLQTLHNFIKTR